MVFRRARTTWFDGDTIDIHGERIGILDVDAPECAQTCKLTGAHVSNNWQCGLHVSLMLYNHIGARVVTCDSDGLDAYNRHLARCAVGGEDISTWLAESGWAVPDRGCKCEVIRKAAERAKALKLGLWASEFQMPWEWRKAH